MKEQLIDFRNEFRNLSVKANKLRDEFKSVLTICREAADIAVQWQQSKLEKESLKIAVDSWKTLEKVMEALDEEDGDAALKFVHELLFVTFPEESRVKELLQQLNSEWIRKCLEDIAARRQDSVAQIRDMLQRRISQTLEQIGFEKDLLCFYNQTQRWKKVQRLVVQLDDLQYYADKAFTLDSKTSETFGTRWYLIPFCSNISSRFEYHFLSNRETARVDRPEWASTFLLERWNEMQSVLDEGIQVVSNSNNNAR